MQKRKKSVRNFLQIDKPFFKSTEHISTLSLHHCCRGILVMFGTNMTGLPSSTNIHWSVITNFNSLYFCYWVWIAWPTFPFNIIKLLDGCKIALAWLDPTVLDSRGWIYGNGTHQHFLYASRPQEHLKINFTPKCERDEGTSHHRVDICTCKNEQLIFHILIYMSHIVENIYFCIYLWVPGGIEWRLHHSEKHVVRSTWWEARLKSLLMTLSCFMRYALRGTERGCNRTYRSSDAVVTEVAIRLQWSKM